MSGRQGALIYFTSKVDERWMFSWFLDVLLSLRSPDVDATKLTFTITSLSKMIPELERLFTKLNISYKILPLEGNNIKNLKLHHLEFMMEGTVLFLIKGAPLNVHLDSVIKSYRTPVIMLPVSGAVKTNTELMSAIQTLLSDYKEDIK